MLKIGQRVCLIKVALDTLKKHCLDEINRSNGVFVDTILYFVGTFL